MSRQSLGYLGAALLVLGVFLPLVSAPLLGSVNYFQNGRGDGVLILLLGVASAIAVANRKYRFLWFSGGAAIAVLGFTLISFNVRMSQTREEMRVDLADNPFRGLAEGMVDTVQLQYGWAVLLIGGILLLVAAAKKGEADAGESDAP